MMNVMNFQDYDVIQDFFSALEKKNVNEAKDCLAFNFSSVVLRKPVKREEFIQVYQCIKEGIPDAKFRITDLTTDGETFKANVKITGTHSKTIPSIRRGWHSMKPTRKKINAVITSVEIILHGKQIVEIRNLEEDKGVISGLLNELQLLPKKYSVN